MMRGVLAVILVAAALALTHTARADFAAGVAAYDEGDYETALAEWLPLAEAGDPAAQRNLGHLYRKGLGTERNLKTAADWYRRAAEMGFARAQANLASLYLRGDGVEQDYNEAAKWFDSAARQDHAIAQFNLGLMYERGLGVPRSKEKAFGWYYQAARAGHTRAAEKLAGLVAETPGPSGGAPPLPDPPPVFKTVEPVQSTDSGPKTAARPAEPPPASSPPVAKASPPPVEAAPEPAVATVHPAPAPAPAATPAPPPEAPAEATAEAETGDEEESPSGGGSLLQSIFSYNNDILYPDRSSAPKAEPVEDETGEDPAAVEVEAGDGASLLPPDSGAATAEAVKEEQAQAPASEAPATTEVAAESPTPEAEPTPAAEPEPTESETAADTPFSLAEWLRIAGEQTTLKIDGGGSNASKTAPTPAPAPANKSEAAPEPPAAAVPEVASQIVTPAPRTRDLDPARFREGQTAFDSGDREGALAAWRALAEGDDPEAQFLVGRMYSNGEGTGPDLEQAYAWLSLAANRDHIEAAKALRKLVRDMTPDQIATAEFLVEARQDRR